MGVNGCWEMFCIASDCGPQSLQHVDATGHTYTYREVQKTASELKVDDLVKTEGVIGRITKIEPNTQLPGILHVYASAFGQPSKVRKDGGPVTLGGYVHFRKYQTVTVLVDD